MNRLLISNPATLKPLGEVAACGDADVAAAVAAAVAAGADWRRVPDAQRTALLRAAAVRIRAQSDALIAMLMRESGLPRCEARDVVEWTAACVEDPAAGFGAHGVVAATAPPSLPLLLLSRQIAPAIAAGNTVVCLPPAANPLVHLLFAECFDALPSGVLNMITGGNDAWNLLLRHPGVNLSASVAAPVIDRVVVSQEADLDLAVAAIAWSRLRHSGQDCTSTMRIYVEQAIARPFADRLHAYVAFLEVADPVRPETDLGPLLSLEAVSTLERQVGHALQEGARLLLGGRRFQPWGLPGHFFQPTILTDLRADSVAAGSAMLGPVLAIIPVAAAGDAARLEGVEVPPQFWAERRPWWFPYAERSKGGSTAPAPGA